MSRARRRSTWPATCGGDIIPLGASPNTLSGNLLNAAALSVMTETLNIESIACRESALHGLGHWHDVYPAEVELIIDRFLSATVNFGLKRSTMRRSRVAAVSSKNKV